MVRTPGFHPGNPGSIPGQGVVCTSNIHCIPLFILAFTAAQDTACARVATVAYYYPTVDFTGLKRKLAERVIGTRGTQALRCVHVFVATIQGGGHGSRSSVG